MKKIIFSILILCISNACGKDYTDPYVTNLNNETASLTRNGDSPNSDEELSLGQKLTNPYNIDIMNSAYQGLYGEVDFFDPNYYYVRFKPEDSIDLSLLFNSNLELYDYPLDYELSSDGDYYHDPSIPEDELTWMYTVVPTNYQFSNITMPYEILEECYIPEESEPEDLELDTNATANSMNSTINSSNNHDIDFEELERQAYILSGNSHLLDTQMTRAPKMAPRGYIYVYDGATPFPISGAKVRVNRFVKISTAVTNNNGYYIVDKKYNSQKSVNITVSFENPTESFRIYRRCINAKVKYKNVTNNGVALLRIYSKKDEALSYNNLDKVNNFAWSAAIVFNAATQYYKYCTQLGLTKPPLNLRISLKRTNFYTGGAPMLSRIVVDNYILDNITELYGAEDEESISLYVKIFKNLLPDISMSFFKDGRLFSRAELSKTTFHELSHASHYSMVGSSYWEEYILEVVNSFLNNHDNNYGTPTTSHHTGVGEMWAGYCEEKMASMAGLSTLNQNKLLDIYSDMNIEWIRPQVLFNIAVLLDLDIVDVFNAVVCDPPAWTINSIDKLKNAFIEWYGDTDERKDIINHTFNCYYKDCNISFFVHNTSPMPRYLFAYIASTNNTTTQTQTYLEAKCVTKIHENLAFNYHSLKRAYEVNINNTPYEMGFQFVNNVCIYDTNVMNYPLRVFHYDNPIQINDFFKESSWIRDEDTINLIYKYTYATDF